MTRAGARKAISATMWAIAGTWHRGSEFFYCGTHLTRRDAVEEFCENIGHSWAQLRAEGNRAVKVRIVEVLPRRRARPKRKEAKRGR